MDRWTVIGADEGGRAYKDIEVDRWQKLKWIDIDVDVD